MGGWLTGLTVAAIVGTGVVSGIVFIFSNTIMAALARQGPDAGPTTMVAINAEILNPVFLALFVGTGVVCLAATGLAWAGGHENRELIGLATAVYLVGMLGVTAAVNVPLNDRLTAMPPGSDEARALWATYLARWTRWNTVRTVAGIAATLLFALAR